jgi:hypothetical protein
VKSAKENIHRRTYTDVVYGICHMSHVRFHTSHVTSLTRTVGQTLDKPYMRRCKLSQYIPPLEFHHLLLLLLCLCPPPSLQTPNPYILRRNRPQSLPRHNTRISRPNRNYYSTVTLQHTANWLVRKRRGRAPTTAQHPHALDGLNRVDGGDHGVENMHGCGGTKRLVSALGADGARVFITMM